MRTTQQDIKAWFEAGVKKNATHMLVVCDSFDHIDYPVYVMFGDSVNKKEKEYTNEKKMSKVMEIYNLKKDMYPQLDQTRCFEY